MMIPLPYLGWRLGEQYVAANHDALTGVLNLGCALAKFARTAAKADRRKDNLLLFVVDADDFKKNQRHLRPNRCAWPPPGAKAV